MNINNAVDKAYEAMDLKELLKAPVSALQGLSEKDAELLKEAFGINTIEQLANNRFFRRAQAIVILAATEQ